MIYESVIGKVWEHPLDSGETLVCFTLAEVPEHGFWFSVDRLPLLMEAAELKTRVRVMASVPEPVRCDDPRCGDGCCESDECTNVPEEERQEPFLLRADTVERI
jgi:hypothetical protein